MPKKSIPCPLMDEEDDFISGRFKNRTNVIRQRKFKIRTISTVDFSVSLIKMQNMSEALKNNKD
jgi:hypothetical protein